MENLRHALNTESARVEASRALRAPIEAIRLVPENGRLEIELTGDLAGILALASDRPCVPRDNQGERCKYARNIDPSPKIIQQIDFARIYENLAGSSFARNVTPYRKSIHKINQRHASL